MRGVEAELKRHPGLKIPILFTPSLGQNAEGLFATGTSSAGHQFPNVTINLKRFIKRETHLEQAKPLPTQKITYLAWIDTHTRMKFQQQNDLWIHFQRTTSAS